MCIRSRAEAAPVARGGYKPRRPHASPLFRLVQDHLHRLQTVYDERFARDYGPWRPVVAEVADTFLACGILEHGFAHIRCDDCAHEYLLAFSCKGRYFCPSCHAKRPRDLDPVAGHDAARARAASAGGADDPQAAPPLLPGSSPPARRDRPRRAHHADTVPARPARECAAWRTSRRWRRVAYWIGR